MKDRRGNVPFLSRRRLVSVSAAGALAASAVPFSGARAQAWPAKQIRVIAHYPPGGVIDTVSLAFSE